MAGKHTPGPWRIDSEGYTAFVEAYDHLTIAPHGDVWEDTHYRGVVAECVPGVEQDEVAVIAKPGMRRGPEESGDTYLANARLISAAPELLRAAKHALEDLHTVEDGEPNEGMSGVIVELKNAIAKAEGGAL